MAPHSGMYFLAMLVALTPAPTGCDRVSPTSQPVSGAGHTRGIPSPADRLIRVRLLDGLGSCTIAIEDSFDLVDPASGEYLGEAGPSATLSVVVSDGTIRLPALGLTFSQNAIDLLPRGVAPVAVHGQNGETRYRGWLRVVQGSGGGGMLINVVDIEDYLVAVVAAELPRSFHQESFRCQAIVARTYAWFQMQTRGGKRDWDVSATESSQVYGGLQRVEDVPEADAAVRETRGLVCVWDSPDGERIFATYYSSRCGGWTQCGGALGRDAEISPLIGSVRCDSCRDEANGQWGPVRLSKIELTEALQARYPRFRELGTIQRILTSEVTPAGRPIRLIFLDAAGRSIDLEAENFRLSVDPTGRVIRSTFFTFVDDNSHIVLKDGRGFGHGVGLCQYGADGLARSGWIASRILAHYYPYSRLRRAY